MGLQDRDYYRDKHRHEREQEDYRASLLRRPGKVLPAWLSSALLAIALIAVVAMGIRMIQLHKQVDRLERQNAVLEKALRQMADAERKARLTAR